MFARLVRAVVIAAAVVGLVAGCASPPPQPETMRDPSVNFSNFKTFGWAAGGAVDAGDAPLQLLDANIRAAIVDVMQRKGYVEAAAGTTPDLRIAYETAKAEKLESNPVRVGIGVGSWGGNMGGSVSMGSPSVRNYQEGTLVIHAIDVARNAEVWQGRISSRIGKGSLEPAAVTTAVQAAMRDFPAR